MRRSDGGQGSLIRQHALSVIWLPNISHIGGFYSWWPISSNFLILLSECLVVRVQSLEAQNIRVLSFNSSCFLSPQIVIRAFILNSAFFSSSSPPLLFYCNSFVFPSISNCFQYQLLGILLSGISLVLVIWSHPPTHCLDNPLSSNGPCGTQC